MHKIWITILRQNCSVNVDITMRMYKLYKQDASSYGKFRHARIHAANWSDRQVHLSTSRPILVFTSTHN